MNGAKMKWIKKAATEVAVRRGIVSVNEWITRMRFPTFQMMITVG
jgi:hypothetical protein